MDNIFLDLDLSIEDAQLRLNDALKFAEQLREQGPEWPQLEEFIEKIKEAKLLLRIPGEVETAITEVEEELEHFADLHDAQSY